MAEHLLRRRLRSVGIDATVRSAGFRFEGRPAERGAVAALAKLGIDLEGHRSTIVTPEHVAAADLVVGMEQAHVRDLAVLPGADLDRIFTFPDLVARAEAVGGRGPLPVATWLARLVGGRVPTDLLGTRPDLEVEDPMGRSKRAFRSSAGQLDDLSARLVALAWPPNAAGDQPAPIHHPTPGSI